jgi:hypothetical protein
MPIELDAIAGVDPPRLVMQGLDRTGDVTIGLTPALLSSVASRGIAPTGATPGAEPPLEPLRPAVVVVVPDAVPPPQDDADDVPIVFVATPEPSKVETVPFMPLAEIPLPAHGSVLAVEPSSNGLTPPGESSVAPSGIPTAPTDDVVPGTPSGEVVPMAGDVGIRGAICAKLGLTLSSTSSDPTARIFSASCHCAMLRKSSIACAFAVAGMVVFKRRIDISVFSGGTRKCRCRESTVAGASRH